jgi:hypothetical protein
MIFLAALLAAAAPQPGALKTFADWTVGCDNGRVCQAVALLPEDGADGATLTLVRGAEAGAVPEVWVTVRAEGMQSPETLVIDGKSFPLVLDRQTETLRVRDGAGAARMLGQAVKAVALGPGGAGRAAVSTRGSAAALLYMDEQQRRVGTTGALVRRGPATDVPSPPALPVVQRPPAPARAARGLTKAQLRRLLGQEATVCEFAQDVSVETARLDARHSLVLASHPCGNGAYNLWSSAFIVDERGRARRAVFDGQSRASEGFDGLVNAGWDPDRRVLTTFMKGRGIGDCGNGQEFAWDGTRFRLVRQSVMGECRGSTDYITTWRAELR